MNIDEVVLVSRNLQEFDNPVVFRGFLRTDQ